MQPPLLHPAAQGYLVGGVILLDKDAFAAAVAEHLVKALSYFRSRIEPVDTALPLRVEGFYNNRKV